jgi:hypothetical protein
MSELADSIECIAKKMLTVSETATLLKQLHWPEANVPTQSLRERDAAGDPDPEPGGYSEIEAVYLSGRITLKEYTHLVEAVKAMTQVVAFAG